MKLKPMSLDELKTEALYYLRPGAAGWHRRTMTVGEMFARITGRQRVGRARIEIQIYRNLGRALQELKRSGTVVHVGKSKGGPGWRRV